MILAPYRDGIPIVADQNDRTQQFAVPNVDQRVYNKADGAIQRWDGANWNQVGAEAPYV